MTDGANPGVYTGSYEFVECPDSFVSGPVRIRFLEVDGKYENGKMVEYFIQPMNNKRKIQEISYNDAEPYDDGTRAVQIGLSGTQIYWWQGAGMRIPSKLQIWDVSGECLGGVTLTEEKMAAG